MEINDLLKTVKKHFIAFLAALLVCEGGVFLVNKFAKPQYQASASLVATISSTESGTYNEFLASQMLTKTYEDAIQSRYIANEAKKKLNTSDTAYELLKKIEVRTDPGTLVIVLYATEDNPGDAVAVANAFAKSFIEKSKEIVQNANVMVLDYANAEDAAIPVSPKKLFNYAIGGVIGLLAAMSLSLYLEKRDTSRRKASRKQRDQERLLREWDDSLSI